MTHHTYRKAQGVGAPREVFEDVLDDGAVMNLDVENPTIEIFIKIVVEEMQLRYYRQRTIKSYRICLRHFFRSVKKLPR